MLRERVAMKTDSCSARGLGPYICHKKWGGVLGGGGGGDFCIRRLIPGVKWVLREHRVDDAASTHRHILLAVVGLDTPNLMRARDFSFCARRPRADEILAAVRVSGLVGSFIFATRLPPS